MVFTDDEIVTFFTGVGYIGLVNHTVLALSLEGIINPADLAEFDKDGLEQIYRNLRKPARMLGEDGALHDVEPFTIGDWCKVPDAHQRVCTTCHSVLRGRCS